MPRSPEQLGAGSVVVVVGRANLAESEHHTARRPRGAPGRRARGAGSCRCSAGATSGRAHRPPASPPGEGGLDTPGILAAAAEGKVALPRAARRRPAVRLARRRAGRQGAGRRGDGHRRRHPPDAVVAAGPTSCSPPPAPGEKAGTTTNLEGRVTALSQKITPPARPDRTGSSPPTWRPRWAPIWTRPRSRSFTSCRRPPCPRSPRRPARRAGRGPRRRAPRLRDPAVARRRRRSGARAPQFATTCASWSAAASTTPGHGRGPRRRWPHWRPVTRLHVHPLDLDRLGATTGAALLVSLLARQPDDRGRGRCRRVPRRGLAAVQPARRGASARLLAGADGVIDVRLENPS